MCSRSGGKGFRSGMRGLDVRGMRGSRGRDARGWGPEAPQLPSSSSWKLSRLARGTSLFSRGLLRGFSPLPGSALPGKQPPASAPEPGVNAEEAGSPEPSSDSPPGALSLLPGPGSSPVHGGGNNGGGSCSSSRSRSSSSESFRLRTFTRRAFRNIPAARTAVSTPAPRRRPRQCRARDSARAPSRVPARSCLSSRYGAPRTAHALALSVLDAHSAPLATTSAFCTVLCRPGGLLAPNAGTPVLSDGSQRGS